jgi:hypothetical protein
MSKTYIARASLEVNGVVTDDIKSIDISEYDVFKKVRLMFKSGEVQITKRYSGSFVYVVPLTNPFSFDTLIDGNITVDYENGVREEFGGVYVEKIGAKKIDGENEIVQTITWIAETRNGNTGATIQPV